MTWEQYAPESWGIFDEKSGRLLVSVHALNAPIIPTTRSHPSLACVQDHAKRLVRDDLAGATFKTVDQAKAAVEASFARPAALQPLQTGAASGLVWTLEK